MNFIQVKTLLEEYNGGQGVRRGPYVRRSITGACLIDHALLLFGPASVFTAIPRCARHPPAKLGDNYIVHSVDPNLRRLRCCGGPSSSAGDRQVQERALHLKRRTQSEYRDLVSIRMVLHLSFFSLLVLVRKSTLLGDLNVKTTYLYPKVRHADLAHSKVWSSRLCD